MAKAEVRRVKAMKRLGAKLPKLSSLKHPMQPIGFDAANTIRFKENKIVRFLLGACACGYKFSLNDLALQMQCGGKIFSPGPLVEAGIAPGGPPFVMLKKPFTVPEEPFTKADYTQLMQLIGYSVSGAGDLSAFSRKVIDAADVESEKIWKAAEKT